MLVPGVGAATGLGGASVCAETSMKAPANATEIDAIATAILHSESRKFTIVRGYRLRRRRLRARERSARQSDYAVITDDRIRLPGHTRARGGAGSSRLPSAPVSETRRCQLAEGTAQTPQYPAPRASEGSASHSQRCPLSRRHRVSTPHRRLQLSRASRIARSSARSRGAAAVVRKNLRRCCQTLFPYRADRRRRAHTRIRPDAAQENRIDRKSTRLNSSHD